MGRRTRRSSRSAGHGAGKPSPDSAAPATLAELLMQAIRLVSARKRRESREARAREEALLEVLQELMRNGI